MNDKESFLNKIKGVKTINNIKENSNNNKSVENVENGNFDKAAEELSIEKVNDELNIYNDQLEYNKIKKELADFKEIALRKAAELDNLKKRSQEELEKAIKYSISNFSKELLPVMDALYLAVDNVPKEELKTNNKFNNFFEGVNITLNELKKVFDKNNIKRIYPLNEMFDHDLHQAIMQVESDKEEGTIVNVIQAGYTLNDRLIRPAMVGVSTGTKNNQ